MKNYTVKGETIFIITDKEMLKRVSEWYKPKWLARYIGGYCTPTNKTIYIKESRKNDIKLINHERGHLRDYKHTLLPTLMFPAWPGRFFNFYSHIKVFDI